MNSRQASALVGNRPSRSSRSAQPTHPHATRASARRGVRRRAARKFEASTDERRRAAGNGSLARPSAFRGRRSVKAGRCRASKRKPAAPEPDAMAGSTTPGQYCDEPHELTELNPGVRVLRPRCRRAESGRSRRRSPHLVVEPTNNATRLIGVPDPASPPNPGYTSPRQSG